MTDEEIIELYKSLVRERITEIFDAEEGEDGTWCTIKFSNGEAHLALIPGVCRWDSRREKELMGGCIDKVGERLFKVDECRHILLYAAYALWVPVEQKKIDRKEL